MIISSNNLGRCTVEDDVVGDNLSLARHFVDLGVAVVIKTIRFKRVHRNQVGWVGNAGYGNVIRRCARRATSGRLVGHCDAENVIIKRITVSGQWHKIRAPGADAVNCFVADFLDQNQVWLCNREVNPAPKLGWESNGRRSKRVELFETC